MLLTPSRAALARAVGLLSILLWAASAAAAPRYLGPNKCISCHDHEKQKDWSATDSHARALSQLEDKNAARYARAIGLADPYSLKGACVACHATVFNADANAGVSCETCHGAGSEYVEPHQEKGSYAKAVALGMVDTRGNYAVWAKMCNECHILRNQKLIAAGHKPGADFDVGAGSKKIVHWAPSYDFSQLSAARPIPTPTRPAPSPKPTAAPAKEPTRPEPTETPARVPTAAAPPSATATPMPPTGTATVPTPAARAVTASVVIEIAVTPIPTTIPLPRTSAAAPSTPAVPTVGALPPPRSATIRPAVKAKLKPQVTPAAPDLPAPTRTPTKRPAPIEPPRRPPH